MNGEKIFCAKPVKQGIIRISKYENMPKNYLERYGIVTIPNSESVDGITADSNSITLPNGRILEFDVRPDGDDSYWKDEMHYQLEKFRDKIPIKLNIEGRPEEELLEMDDTADGWNSGKKFGISFNITDGERFYGLGEAGRDGIELRGGSYQNWAIYQFDEIAIPLVISNENWGIFVFAQDRHFVDIDDRIKGKITVVGNWDDLDVFVLYGGSMKDILYHYTELTGRSMVLPKWAYGLTYIAQIHQNQFEILNDLMKFREKHIPCDNVSLEPGWMTKFYDYSFEKQWDLKKFHIEKWMRSRDCPRTFPSTVRRFGFHLALWLCMNYDLCDHEERLAGGEGKLAPWYEHVKQFVNDGADGFKLDPADMTMRINPNKVYTNGETEMAMHNISQVLVMKQMHEGFAEQMGKRPFIHYCGGYTGQQHWGAATTGDNGGRLGAMIWLENLAMSGFSNTTVDMDIFSAEGIHFAMLAPWAHHNAWSGCEQPWFAGEENERIYTFYARLRYSLIPYIYSSALECSETGVAIIRPMALEFQNDPQCAELSRQYMFGGSILLSAFTDKVYLPEGKWLDYWTDEVLNGGHRLENYVPPKERGGAMFIKMGAIIPKWSQRDYTSQYGDDVIQLHIYPCGKSEYVFREDDGESLDYRTKQSCHTKITCTEHADGVEIIVGERAGEYDGKTKNRMWEVYVHNCDKPVSVKCLEKGAQINLM